MASWNAATTIEASLESVLSQSHQGTELVVIDGASNDGTASIIREHEQRIAHWESAPDRGVYDAWNKALRHASGEWLCFLGADDRFTGPDVLERIAPYLVRARPDYRVAYASIVLVDSAGAVIARIGSPWPQTREGLPERMTLPNPATFYHRTLFDIHGSFDDSLRIAGDYDFLLRELLVHDALYIPDLVAVEMDHGGLASDPRHRARRAREIATIRYRHRLTRVPPWASPVVARAASLDAVARFAGKDRAARLRAWYRRSTGKPPEG